MTQAAILYHLIEAITCIFLALLLRTLYRGFKHNERLKYWAWSWLTMSFALFISASIILLERPQEHPQLGRVW